MLVKRISNKNSGFTLIELIITIAIVSILSAIILVNVNSYVEDAQYATDITNLRTLNSITAFYRVTQDENDPFIDDSNSSSELMDVLVDNGLLSNPVLTQTADTTFLWSFDGMAWYFIEGDVFYTISDSDGLYVSNAALGWLQGSYTGTEKNVLLLSEMSGNLIKELQQDIFKNKGLTSFVFQTPSSVTRIHARAFYNNELSTIVFPETLKRIDLWAFRDNNLTEITLPQSVTTVEQNAFANNNITKITVGSQLNTIGTTAFGTNHAGFVDAYQAGGAGTYVFINGAWIKQ
jgi:prepilin-type N-terminal cleavage/methylation domain-containing protein